MRRGRNGGHLIRDDVTQLAQTATPPRSTGLTALDLAEGFASAAGSLMGFGVYFFTTHRFHWGPGRNFLFAGTQGAVYICGALAADRLTRLFPSPRRAFRLLQVVLAALACLAAAALSTPPIAVALLLCYTFTIAICWPIIESLIAANGPPAAMARRVTVYSFVWSATGAVVIALEGTLIEAWQPLVLFVAAAANLATAVATGLAPEQGAAAAASLTSTLAHPAPEPELLRVRQRALWVSRLSLPAAYAVIFGLMPLMPSLEVMRRFDTREQTLISSAWLVSRWVTFGLLAATAWWHTRPRPCWWHRC